ncbi:MAG: Uncharacterised protein [Flavobacteriia bacterium]|nr:MAG: Uncharacterised protein [Flavobacteriia bacterium]
MDRIRQWPQLQIGQRIETPWIHRVCIRSVQVEQYSTGLSFLRPAADHTFGPAIGPMLCKFTELNNGHPLPLITFFLVQCAQLGPKKTEKEEDR